MGLLAVGLTGRLLLDTIVAVAATVVVGVTFLLFRKELGHAHDAASRGSRVADTDAGLIEYAEKGARIPLLSIHGAGVGFDQGLQYG